MLATVWQALRDGLHEPLSVLGQADSRTYVPMLAVSVLLALVVSALQRRGLLASLRAGASRRLWWHPSARLDYQLICARAFFQTLLFAPLVLSAHGIAVFTFEQLSAAHTLAPLAWPPVAIVAVYTVVLFVAWDFSRYFLHRLMHRVPILWEIHQVHHSAEVLTPFTVYRVHPIESLLYGLRGALTTGVVTGAFFYLFRGQALQAEILGVNALGLAFNALGANLRHSHVWLSWGRALEHVFISPAQHQLHHSADRADFDCNYGSALAVWDWLGGSLRVAAGRQAPTRFGIAERRNHQGHRLGSALAGPLLGVLRALLPARWRPTPSTPTRLRGIAS